MGIIDIHGKQFHPTWTRLSRIVEEGDDLIFLQDEVNWEVGQQLIVTTSNWFDCPAEYQEKFCRNVPHQNEIRSIIAIGESPEGANRLIQVDTPLIYQHFASEDYQTEVALLSRRIGTFLHLSLSLSRSLHAVPYVLWTYV